MRAKILEVIYQLNLNIDYLQHILSHTLGRADVDYYTQIYNQQLMMLKQYLDLNRLDEYQLNDLKSFTLQELEQFDGKDGKPAYVAINGIVYNVTGNPSWKMGSHYGLVPGKDLTQSFMNCHNQKKILDNLSVIGMLKNE